MNQWQRRTLGYLSSLTLLIVVYALAYDYGMTVYESRPQPFYQSLQVVVETFTTTGYGSDAPWETPEMNFFVMLMDATGVVLIFMALPVFVVPLFEQAVSTTLPTSVEMENHVVICTYSPRTETLISELSSWEMEYVIVEPDREQAMELYESDYSVVHGDPESVDSLAKVDVEDAAAVVADASDEVDVSVVLTAREAASEVPVVSVVEEPELATYHELAGVDRVLSPRKLVGESLAGKVTTAVSAELGEAVEIGEDFEVAELPVQRGSHLVGSTLAESGIREQAGANVLGAWFRGEFETPLTPGSTLDAGTVLLVAGRQDQLEQLKELTRSPVRSPRGGRIVVVGHGEVGSTVTDELAANSVPYTVVDIVDKPGVDVVGDTTDPETLEEAGIETARSVLFTLADDTVTSFGTLVARDLNPNVEILARAEETESVQKIYRAGADYVLALSTVSGRMLASTILEDEEVISMDKQVELVRTSAPRFTGQTLAEADIRSETGCTVVAVERNGEVITDLGPDFRLERKDDLIIAGDDEGVTEFTKVAN